MRTPLVRNRLLRLGPLLHLGVTAVIVGHMLGLLVPSTWTAAIGLRQTAYDLISMTAGTLAGATTLVGLVLLAARRITDPAIRRDTSVRAAAGAVRRRGAPRRSSVGWAYARQHDR